jgi:hypothetical protein
MACYLVPLRPKYSPQHPILEQVDYYITHTVRKSEMDGACGTMVERCLQGLGLGTSGKERT